PRLELTERAGYAHHGQHSGVIPARQTPGWWQRCKVRGASVTGRRTLHHPSLITSDIDGGYNPMSNRPAGKALLEYGGDLNVEKLENALGDGQKARRCKYDSDDEETR